MHVKAGRDAFLRGARLFDAGAFFEAHEAWEQRWRVEPDVVERRTLQGLIQIAAGFHKAVVTRDRASASRLLARGLAKLEGCAELAAFTRRIQACADTLALGELSPDAIPKLVE